MSPVYVLFFSIFVHLVHLVLSCPSCCSHYLHILSLFFSVTDILTPIEITTLTTTVQPRPALFGLVCDCQEQGESKERRSVGGEPTVATTHYGPVPTVQHGLASDRHTERTAFGREHDPVFQRKHDPSGSARWWRRTRH